MDHPKNHSLFGLGLPGYIYIIIYIYKSPGRTKLIIASHGSPTIAGNAFGRFNVSGLLYPTPCKVKDN